MSMFTGIVNEIGTVQEIASVAGGIRIHVLEPKIAAELHVGNSVAINGACHTVVQKLTSSFHVDSVEETLKKTALGLLHVNDEVNLELPMTMNDRWGGHLVLGHVDGVGTVTDIESRGTSWVFEFSMPSEFSHYVVRTGSIAIDGVSLTIAEVMDNTIRVSIIPHTMERTIFRRYKINNKVNLEFDVIGKYLERFAATHFSGSDEKRFLSEKHLRELGF